ncbi:MAG: hypothetical protein ACR2J8_11250, partial [Thermomicrobiales bacterium]
MPSPSARSRVIRSSALALGLSLTAAMPIASLAKTPDPDHIDRIVAARLEGHPSSGAILESASGAVAAVQICHGEVHAGTFAAGAFGSAPPVGCDDPGHDNATITLAASGAMAATSGGFAITAPAGAAP